MKEFKLVIIGGGSSYTPELAGGLISRWKQGEFLAREIVLVDIPQGQKRLETVSAFIQRMVQKAGMPARITSTTNRQEALDGASFVVSQMRVGGMKARSMDEHLPLKYGVIGQETTGPGGFANALRTIPVSLELAQDIVRICPKAWLLNFTNPSGLVTEALLRYSDVNTFGLCNVPIGIKMALAKALLASPERVSIDVSGLNHLSFVTGVYLDGKDVSDQVFGSPLFPLYLDQTGIGKIMAPYLQHLKIIPSSYLQYYWGKNRALEKEKKDVEAGKGTRADEVMKIEKELFEMYADPRVDEMPPQLKKRGGAYYSDVALNSISAMVNDRPVVEALNVKNKGAVPGIQPDAVVEVSCMVDGRGPSPIAQKPLPPEVLGLVQKVKAYESLTVEAAVHGDVQKAFFALLNHPLVPDADTAASILKDILAENAEFLPQFKGKTEV
ncbi:MAG: 6-phospho-beta-glucosidase [Candidatus Fermentithermobacillus carboniphilus]|uniref:6-phospho-beta-glucosidase n=1 Tax=Candidatus Fermentithermobacillus carboniphilus TaxID=3085328 RepID=A0AAT9LAG2_9FIRM|nr:MAG: 6-phospho-beta-glucosidase [Candidatus Fermentithermobacillus carboniphilus]